VVSVKSGGADPMKCPICGQAVPCEGACRECQPYLMYAPSLLVNSLGWERLRQAMLAHLELT
jgi:hypothetical protein